MKSDENPALCQLIAARITQTQQQRITFAEYMDLVLYSPQHGYYATNAVNIGSEGDFFTSPHLSADFGELLAEQFVQMWDILGRTVPFTLVEMGAGTGLLAAHILTFLRLRYPDFFDALDYVIVERSPALIAQQQQVLEGVAIRWCTFEEIPSASITGCCFSNELVDALPVYQFVIEGGQLREIYVSTQINIEQNPPSSVVGAGLADHLSTTQTTIQQNRPSGVVGAGLADHPSTTQTTIQQNPPSSGEQEIKFQEVTGEPSTPRLAKYFDLVGIHLSSSAYADGYRSEVNLAALDWLSVVAEKMQRGYLLTIDYGYPSFRYYNPARSQGTLQCYYRHRHHSDPYVHVGCQDITAHVDFTALERQGELCGLQKVGFTQQALFLMALGMSDRIAALSTTNVADAQSLQQVLRRRDALHQLIDPQGLGGFGVLVQSKGLTEDQRGRSLKGLCVPSTDKC